VSSSRASAEASTDRPEPRRGQDPSDRPSPGGHQRAPLLSPALLAAPGNRRGGLADRPRRRARLV